MPIFHTSLAIWLLQSTIYLVPNPQFLTYDRMMDQVQGKTRLCNNHSSASLLSFLFCSNNQHLAAAVFDDDNDDDDEIIDIELPNRLFWRNANISSDRSAKKI